MLSLFPELLFLAPLAAFIMRVAAGTFLGFVAYRHVISPHFPMRTLGVIEGVVAVLLVAGGYTQAAALVGVLVFAIPLFAPTYRVLPRSTLALLILMTLSLIITGAGPFAFDLPL